MANELKHRRRSIRLKDYDYSDAGAYFVTCDQEPLFGQIVNGEMTLNEFGQIVEEEIKKTEEIREYVKIDKYVIMPNHIHIIFVINDDRRGTARRARNDIIYDHKGTARRAPTNEQYQKPVKNSIPTIVQSYKSAVTKRINLLRNTPGIPVWQRNYYEHVVRDERGMNRIRRYVINNPPNWEYDQENRNGLSIDEKKKFWSRFLNEW